MRAKRGNTARGGQRRSTEANAKRISAAQSTANERSRAEQNDRAYRTGSEDNKSTITRP
jgi:hypothetical protein